MTATATAAAARARKGDGSVTWNAARKAYRVRVPQRDRPGQPIERWSPGPESPAAEKAAHALRARLIVDRDTGAPVLDRSLTVGAWLEEWLATKSSARPATRRAYRLRVDQYLVPTLGRHRLADLTPVQIQRAYDRLRESGGERVERLTETTILAVHKTLITALNDARDATPPRIATNPARRLTIRDDAPEIEPPTAAQVATLADCLGASDGPTDAAYRAFYLVAFWTGARQSEIFGLRWSDVDDDARTISYRKQAPQQRDVTAHQRFARTRLKAGRGRTVAVPGFVVDALRDLPGHGGSALIFHRPDGTPWRQWQVKAHYDAAQARCAIAPPDGSDLDHFRLHDFRHGFATMMREAGANDALLLYALGHSSTSMMDRYSHVRPQPGGPAYRAVIDALGADAARDQYGIR